jgi:DMSO/TMAO reductase YedYZ molybdopterin-dependent catalytic subunit
MTRRLFSRRAALVTGLAGAGGYLLTRNLGQLPPTYGHILRMADNATYAAHRALLPDESLVREYTHADISSFPAIGTTNPADAGRSGSELFSTLQRNAFADWRLSVEGLVARPMTVSVADLKRMPSRTQTTRHTCEEGWSAIAEWTGVPLGRILDAAGILPEARWVNFKTYDDWADSIDLIDALHPQTLLAYGMNGRDVTVPHGGPVRLRVERQLGYKSLKFIRTIVVSSTFDDGGKLGSIQNGWSWYAGI